jgi:2-polyprenyl-6-methoxyphenol hydroxylase-like FAD-dependent oxidoreductase
MSHRRHVVPRVKQVDPCHGLSSAASAARENLGISRNLRHDHGLMESRVALIVGAGIGGLAAGVALQRAGWSVRIFERAAHPRELGFALLLAPNAVVSLERLGLVERVVEQGSRMDAGEIRGTNGRLLRRFDMGRMRHLLPQPAVVVLRPALHGILLDAVGKQHLRLASEALGFSVQDGKPVVHLANGERAEGDVLIGADGVASVIRRGLHPHEPPPRRSGLWAVRGVAQDLALRVVGPIGAQYFGRGTEAGLARAGPGWRERRLLVHLGPGGRARRLA